METQKKNVKPTVVEATPVTGHKYSDEEIAAFIEEEMADLLSPVAETSPEAIAFNKAVAGISEFRKLAVIADDAAMAGDDKTFTETINEAMKSVNSLPASFKSTMGINPERSSTMMYNLTNGEVAVFGAEMVGGGRAIKNLDIVLQEMSRKLGRPHNVNSVVFSLTAPKGDLANCAMASRAICVNIMHTFCRSYDKITEETKMAGISINALFWHNVYVSYIHEALHLDDPNLPEEDISTAAKAMAFEIVRDYALEPGSCEFMRGQMAELAIGAKEGDFFDTQKKMFDEGLFYWFKPTAEILELKLKSFRSYMHWASAAADDDIRWISPPKMLAAQIHTPAEVVVQPAQVMTAGASTVSPTFIPPNSEVIMDDQSVYKGVYNDHIDDGGDYFDDGEMMAGDSQFVGSDGDYEDDEYTAPIGAMMAFAQATMPAPTAQPAAPSTAFPAFTQTPAPVATVTNMVADQHSAVKVTLPKTGLTFDQTSVIARGVYSKCFNIIFGLCGQLSNSEKAFSNPNEVSTNIIPLTDVEKQVVVAMNCFMNGRWVKIPTTNGLIGFVGKIKELPTYKLFLNMDGAEACRLVLPQNPGKRDNNGQYSKTAIMAQGGAKILYIMEGDDNAKANGAKQYICKAVVAPGAQLTEWVAC